MISPAIVPHLIAAAAEAFGSTPDEILGGSRVSHIKDARHVAIYLARTQAKLTLERSAFALGQLDISSARYAVKRVERLVAADPHWRVVVEEVLTRAFELQRAEILARAAPSPA